MKNAKGTPYIKIKLNFLYSGYNNLEVADYLLEQGADVNAQEFI